MEKRILFQTAFGCQIIGLVISSGTNLIDFLTF